MPDRNLMWLKRSVSCQHLSSIRTVRFLLLIETPHAANNTLQLSGVGQGRARIIQILPRVLFTFQRNRTMTSPFHLSHYQAQKTMWTQYTRPETSLHLLINVSVRADTDCSSNQHWTLFWSIQLLQNRVFNYLKSKQSQLQYKSLNFPLKAQWLKLSCVTVTSHYKCILIC